MPQVSPDEVLKTIETAFELDAGTLHASTTMEEIPNWGSLGVLTLLAAFDEEMGISLKPSQIMQCATINDFIKLCNEQ